MRKLLLFLSKTFWYERFSYTLPLSDKDVLGKLHALFTGAPINLAGRFDHYPETFTIKPKEWSGMFHSMEKEPAILKGRISSVSTTKTVVEIKVRTNSFFLIFVSVCLPFWLYSLYSSIIESDGTKAWTSIGAIIFIFPLLYFLSRGYSRSLRNDFEKYIGVHG